MQDYGNVLNTFSDYLIYDERKGRVLHTRYLNKGQFLEMWRFHFNRLRPDMSKTEERKFILAQKAVRGILAVLRNQSLNELKREVVIHPSGFIEKNFELLINHLNYLAPCTAGTFGPKMVDWVDATRNYNYMRDILNKTEGFGLMYPVFMPVLSDEQKVVYEEQLYRHFKKLLSKN
jgi:hypothetical protein